MCRGSSAPCCFGRTNFITAPFCVRCGVPFASVEQGGTEGRARAVGTHPPLFRQARAALRYDEQARRLILPLKHADRLELAPVLAPMMARAGRGVAAAGGRAGAGAAAPAAAVPPEIQPGGGAGVRGRQAGGPAGAAGRADPDAAHRAAGRKIAGGAGAGGRRSFTRAASRRS